MANPFDKLKHLMPDLPVGPLPVVAPVAAASPRFGPKVVVRRERKGRGGKTVTFVEGVLLQGEALESFARDMKRALGCGATIEGGAVVLLGDIADRAAEWLSANGAPRVIRGA